MDTELARTFLVVVATGSFVEAAQRLHVTQSTVSTRIQRLEETLGAELFVRNKAGTTLTPAGQQFQRHAALLTRTVEQARQEIGIVSGFRATLTIGCRIGLWEDLLLRWLPIFASLAPDVAVRALVGLEEELMQSLIDGRSSIGVMYTPQARPGLTIELLLEEHLVMVSTRAESSPEPASDYIYVDWAQNSLANTAWHSPTSRGPRSRSTSVGSGCSAFSHTAEPATSRRGCCASTNSPAGCIASPTHPNSGYPVTCAFRRRWSLSRSRLRSTRSDASRRRRRERVSGKFEVGDHVH